MRLCWADKVPLALFGIITLILLFLGMGENPDPSEYCRWLKLENPDWTSHESYCFVTSAQHWSAFLSIEGMLFWNIVLPVWAMTRIVDLSMGGPAIRRRARGGMPIDVPMADIEMPRERWPMSEPDWHPPPRS
jgi:hypothetical protein